MAKNRHLVLLALKIPDPNSFGHLTWNMLQGLWWAGLESIQQGFFKEHFGSACPAGRRALQHSFAGLDSSVFAGRCQPCTAVRVQGGRPVIHRAERWFALHVWAGARSVKPIVTLTSCRSFLERVEAHSQRFLQHPSPLGHQSCPPRTVQCPNTICPLHFPLASAVCF